MDIAKISEKLWANKTPEQRAAIAAKSHATRLANRTKAAALEEEQRKYAGELGEKIAALEQQLAQLEKHKLYSDMSCSLNGERLLKEREIVQGAYNWSGQCGVYFLIDGAEVVYVGQSVNIYTRIGSHTDKKFNRFAYVLCDKDHLDALESLYIHCLSPRLNGVMKNSAKSAPIPLVYLLQNLRRRPGERQ